MTPSSSSLDSAAKNVWNKVPIDPQVGTSWCFLQRRLLRVSGIPSLVSGLHFPLCGSFTPGTWLCSLLWFSVFSFAYCLPCIEAKVAFSLQLIITLLVNFLFTCWGHVPPDLFLFYAPTTVMCQVNGFWCFSLKGPSLSPN